MRVTLTETPDRVPGLDATDAAGLTPVAIGRLQPQQISEMTVWEMLRVIEAADPLFLHEPPAEGNWGRATLEQLVYLARRHCRQQTEGPAPVR